MLVMQISDIHASRGASSLNRLDIALSMAADLGVDALMVAGDLANDPHEDGYPLVAERLSRVGMPIIMVPGNVDDRAWMRRTFPAQDWPAAGRLNAELVLGDELRIIGLDVTVPGEVHGDFGAETEAFLAERLETAGPPAIIMMHQHPFRTAISMSDSVRCRNSEALAALIEAHAGSVLGVVCGHGHRPLFSQIGGVPAMMGPAILGAAAIPLAEGAKIAFADPPGLTIHDVSTGALVSHIVPIIA